MKKTISLSAVFLLIFVGFYFYFFCFYIRIINESKVFDIDEFKCESTFGEEWDFGNIKKGEHINRIITIGHGAALSCVVRAEGYEPNPILVVGYFNEDTSNIEVLLMDSEEGIEIKLNELNF